MCVSVCVCIQGCVLGESLSFEGRPEVTFESRLPEDEAVSMGLYEQRAEQAEPM